MESIPLPHPDPAVSIIIIIVCILCVAFFSSSEASLISVSRLKIRSLVEKGNKRAKAIQRMREEHDTLFGTILLTENFFIILASSLGTALAISMFPGHEAVTIAASVVMTIIIVMFGEITPKTFAASNALRVALFAARYLAYRKAIDAVAPGLTYALGELGDGSPANLGRERAGQHSM